MNPRSEEETYLAELVDHLKDQFASRNKAVAERRKARDGEDFTLEDVPEAYRSTTQIVNIARNADVLQRMQAIVTDDDPAWEKPPASEEEKDKRQSSLTERWLSAAIDRMYEESGRDAIRMAVDSALADGVGVLKLTYLPDAWKDEPSREYMVEEAGQKVKKEKDAAQYLKEVDDYRKSARFPFWLEDIDLLCYYPLREGREITEVLEISERPLLPAMKSFNVIAEKDDAGRRYRKLRKGQKYPEDSGAGTDRMNKVLCVERWRRNDVTYYLDGQKVDYIQHNYGFINYVEIAGYQTSSRDPGKAIRSVIDGQRQLVKEMRRILTIWLNWAYMAGWPYLEAPEITGAGSGIPDGATTITQLEAGAILAHGTRFIEPPTAGRDLNQLAQIFQAEADRSGLASVMYGNSAGISSGYMGADLRAAAQSVLRPIIRNSGHALGMIGQMLLRLIDRRVQAPVYVYGVVGEAPTTSRGNQRVNKKYQGWLALGPDDIHGYYPVKATMQPLMPMDEVAQRDSAIRMYQAGLWDPETALEHTNEQQPERILDRVWAYKYLEKSGLNDKLGEKAAQEAGLIPPPEAVPAPVGPPTSPEQPILPSGLGPESLGGPGIPAAGPSLPSVPGMNMPLVPPQPNMPIVPRRPGVFVPPAPQVP